MTDEVRRIRSKVYLDADDNVDLLSGCILCGCASDFPMPPFASTGGLFREVYRDTRTLRRALELLLKECEVEGICSRTIRHVLTRSNGNLFCLKCLTTLDRGMKSAAMILDEERRLRQLGRKLKVDKRWRNIRNTNDWKGIDQETQTDEDHWNSSSIREIYTPSEVQPDDDDEDESPFRILLRWCDEATEETDDNIEITEDFTLKMDSAAFDDEDENTCSESSDDEDDERKIWRAEMKNFDPSMEPFEEHQVIQEKSNNLPELKEIIIRKSSKKSPVVEKPSKAKTPKSIKLPRISPKLLRSRKSLPAAAISLPVASKTPKKRKIKDTPKTATPVSIVLRKRKKEPTESSITPKSLKKSSKIESPVPEKFSKFFPKLLRSRKSDISSLTVRALLSKKYTQKTSASNKKASISNSPAHKTPKVKGSSTPALSGKRELPETKNSRKFPEFSPKLLRSRKSDASALQKKGPEGQKSKNKTPAAGRKSVR